MGGGSVGNFLTEEKFGLSVWIWLVIALVVIVAIIVIIAVCVSKSKKKKSASSNAEVQPVESENKVNNSAPVVEEKKTTAEDSVVIPVKEEPVKDEPVQKASTAKTTAKPASSKPAAKTAQKDESEAPKVYHISKRASDKKWQVKAEGADKALRLFFTQADAIEYAKKVAGNQSGRIVVHKEGGGFRKLNY